MPRGCGCAGNSCGCLIVGGAGIQVVGTGNESSPYVIGLNNESGYLSIAASEWANAVNLQNMVAGDIVVEVSTYATDPVSIRLPDTAPLGTRLDLITYSNVPPVTFTLTFPTGSIYWPGGAVPTIIAQRNLIKMIFGTQGGGLGAAWYGVAHLAMA